MGRKSRLKKERRESHRRAWNDRREAPGRSAGGGIDFNAETVFETLKGDGGPTPIPQEEFARIRDAMVKAEPWFREKSVAYGRPDAPYEPSVQIFGSNDAWRWILDIRSRREARAASDPLEIIGDCIGEFGNAAYRSVVESDSTETFFVGDEVVSRANKAGAEIIPLAGDEELGIRRIPDGVHCTCCSTVFSKAGDPDVTGLCEPCREEHGPAKSVGPA